jgi:cytochrome c biogenesis protein CcmG, thiol:disulfide interchange protein DsbE
LGNRSLHCESKTRGALALRLTLLLAVVWTVAPAQDATEILHRTAETYRVSHSFEASGVLSTRITIAGVSYDLAWPVSLAQADSTLLPPDSPVPMLSPLLRFGSRELRSTGGEVVRLATAEPSSPKGWAQFDQIDRHVQEIRSLSTETIVFAGRPAACWVLEVVYQPGFPARALSGRPARYWIDPSSYLVLRESFEQRGVSQHEFVKWDFAATSVKVNEPPPAWAVGALPQLAGYERTDWIDRPAPEFTLADFDGREVSLGALRGYAVLLSFWASWCVPCKEEVPLIEKIAAEFQPRGLVVWGITNESPTKARGWLEDNGRRLPTLVDTGRQAFRDYEAETIPVSVVIDRDGKIVSYRVGLSGGAQLRQAIDRALKIHREKP